MASQIITATGLTLAEVEAFLSVKPLELPPPVELTRLWSTTDRTSLV